MLNSKISVSQVECKINHNLAKFANDTKIIELDILIDPLIKEIQFHVLGHGKTWGRKWTVDRYFGELSQAVDEYNKW